jgi:hypothetical protein
MGYMLGGTPTASGSSKLQLVFNTAGQRYWRSFIAGVTVDILPRLKSWAFSSNLCKSRATSQMSIKGATTERLWASTRSAIESDTIEASVYSTIVETYSNLLRALLDAVGGRPDLESAV